MDCHIYYFRADNQYNKQFTNSRVRVEVPILNETTKIFHMTSDIFHMSYGIFPLACPPYLLSWRQRMSTTIVEIGSKPKGKGCKKHDAFRLVVGWKYSRLVFAGNNGRRSLCPQVRRQGGAFSGCRP